jgi:hypothetical protein
VRALRALPSCEVLEVARVAGGELLVPLVADAVRRVDVAARRIDVDLAFLGEEALPPGSAPPAPDPDPPAPPAPGRPAPASDPPA